MAHAGDRSLKFTFRLEHLLLSGPLVFFLLRQELFANIFHSEEALLYIAKRTIRQEGKQLQSITLYVCVCVFGCVSVGDDLLRD